MPDDQRLIAATGLGAQDHGRGEDRDTHMEQ
jgi:hypothetical protein